MRVHNEVACQDAFLKTYMSYYDISTKDSYSHASWMCRNSLSFIDRLRLYIILAAYPEIHGSSLNTAGDICLRNFYAGSWHNGIRLVERGSRG